MLAVNAILVSVHYENLLLKIIIKNKLKKTLQPRKVENHQHSVLRMRLKTGRR